MWHGLTSWRCCGTGRGRPGRWPCLRGWRGTATARTRCRSAGADQRPWRSGRRGRRATPPWRGSAGKGSGHTPSGRWTGGRRRRRGQRTFNTSPLSSGLKSYNINFIIFTFYFFQFSFNLIWSFFFNFWNLWKWRSFITIASHWEVLEFQ